MTDDDIAALVQTAERYEVLKQRVIRSLVFVEKWETEIPWNHPLREMIDHLRRDVTDGWPKPSEPRK